MKTQTDRPIQLRCDGGNVVITPEDEDRFVKESNWAVAACQSRLAVERFSEQFKSEFLANIHAWCLQHSDKVLSAFVPMSPFPHLQVFVVTQSRRYDFSLSESLSTLEMELHEKSWPCEVLQIPNGRLESLQTFFDPERSVQVYGDEIRTSEESGEPSGLSPANPG